MAWEERGSSRYYYRKVWREGTCVSEYVGAGDIGQLCSRLAEEAALEKGLQRHQWLQTSEPYVLAEQELTQWLCRVRRVVDATLHRWGYHRHKRQWRLRRMKGSAMEVVIKVDMDDQTLRQTMDLIVAKKLTPAQEQQLAAALDAEPQIVEIVGNIGTQLRRDRIASMAKQPGYEMVMQRKVKAMRAELESAEASPTERLVIDSVITCWLDLQWMQNGYQHFWTKGGTTQQAELWERRLSAAHSRFLKQVEALAKLHYLSSRMQRVQINVAQNQVVANG